MSKEEVLTTTGLVSPPSTKEKTKTKAACIFPKLNYTLWTAAIFEPRALGSKSRFALEPGYSECSPWTCSLRVTWSLLEKFKISGPTRKPADLGPAFEQVPRRLVCVSELVKH